MVNSAERIIKKICLLIAGKSWNGNVPRETRFSKEVNRKPPKPKRMLGLRNIYRRQNEDYLLKDAR